MKRGKANEADGKKKKEMLDKMGGYIILVAGKLVQ